MSIFNFSTLPLVVLLLLVVGQQQVDAALRFKKPSSARALQDEGEESGRQGGRHLGKGGKGKGGSSSTTCPSKFSKMTKMTNKTATKTATSSSNSTSKSSDDELGWCEDFGICECSPLPEEERCRLYGECFAFACVRSDECLEAARYICPEDPASLCNDQIVDEFCMLFVSVSVGGDVCLENCKNYVSNCCKPDICPECMTDAECASTQECVGGVCKTKGCTEDEDCDCPDGRDKDTCTSICFEGSCVPFNPDNDDCDFDGDCDSGEDQINCPSDCCDCTDVPSWDPVPGKCGEFCADQSDGCFPYDNVGKGTVQNPETECIDHGQDGGLSFLDLCGKYEEKPWSGAQNYCQIVLGVPEAKGCKNACAKHHESCCLSCDDASDCDTGFDCCTDTSFNGGAGVCIPSSLNACP